MPNTQSSSKRLRQSVVRRNRNRAVRSNMRNTIRRVHEAVAAKDLEKAQTEFRLASKKLDRAAAHNIIHPNVASRTKSRLNAAIKKVALAS